MRPCATLLLLVAATLPSATAWTTASAAAPRAWHVADEVPDTLEFITRPYDSFDTLGEPVVEPANEEPEWMRAPIGDGLLTDRDQWRARPGGRFNNVTGFGGYNRVDRLKLGIGYQLQVHEPMAPRLGARFEYAFGRDRALYGFQLEQPVIPPGRIAIGASLVRRTDHHELHQVPEAENTAALLFARQDYRDYWEREGIGGYVAWRVPDFSNVSVHIRRDEYRTLVDRGATSWFHRGRILRPNPPIDDGETHTVALRLERIALSTRHTPAGTYHWIEAEWAGRGLGGDFTYTRLLGDVRGVLRLSPATTLMLRAVAGHTPAGALPVQKAFPIGGVDGLRAHSFAQFRGEQALLLQAEYVIGLWKLRTGAFEGGLHAIAFVDAGKAWTDPRHRWSVTGQQIEVDGGVGLAAAEDKLRVYFAKDLRHSDSKFVASVRLQRPF
ncbi:MAG: BamA/TamA family outer membrane protein [Candidatus Eiseniibacteriota bacterium]